jgi:hypothetical protein
MMNVSLYVCWLSKVITFASVVVLAVLTSSVLALAAGPPTGENAYCEKGNVATFGDKDGPAELPKTCYYTGLDGTPSPGKEIRLASNANLAEAMDRAKCGDTLQLAAGASYEIKAFPKKNCDDQHYMTVRTDTPDSKLPPEGTRITPAWAGVASLPGRPAYAQPSGGPAKLMATIVLHAIPETLVGDHYRFIGIEWTSAPDAKTTRMISTEGADHVIFDRNWFHASEDVEMAKGIMMTHGTQYIAVVNSYFSGFNCVARSGSCTDASAIGGGNGTADMKVNTLKLYNNFLEASGQNIIFGGAASEINPYDIEIRRNHLFRPMSWKEGQPGYKPSPKGDPLIVKNNFELKNARRVLFEANLLENSWGGFSQTGFSILLTPKNQNDHCPKCAVTDVTVRYNLVRNVASGVQIANVDSGTGGSSSDGGRYSIHDLIVEGVHGEDWKGKAAFAFILSREPVLHDVSFDHVTSFAPGVIFSIHSEERIPNFSVTNSIFTAGEMRPELASAGGGKANCATQAMRVSAKAVLDACFNNPKFEKNLIIGGKVGGWPSGTIAVSSLEAAGIRPLETGFSKDPHLCRAKEAGCNRASPGVGAATDGKDVGADIDAVNAAIAGIE